MTYRLGVGAILVNKEKQVFVGQRLDMKDPAWQFPQGGLDAGEAPTDALRRELAEETSITAFTPAACAPKWFTYTFPPTLAKTLWAGKYVGQRQLWHLLQYDGLDAEINIVTDHPEFSAWKWGDFETVVREIVPFKKSLYTQLYAYFSPHI